MKDIVKIFKNYKLLWKEFYYLVVWLLVTEFLLTLFPQIANKMMTVIENKWDFRDLLFWWGVSFLLIIFSSAWWLYFDKAMANLWRKLYSIKYQIYRKELFKKSYSQLIEEWTWKLISRFERAVIAESDIFMAIVELLTNTFFKLIIVSIVLAIYFPIFLVFLFFFLLLLFLVNYFVRKKIWKLVKKQNKYMEINTKLLVKMINEFLIIKIFNKEKLELKKSKKILDKLPSLEENVRKYQIIFYVLLFFTIRLLELMIYIWVWYYILQWQFSIALLVMLTGYMWILWNPIDKAISEFNRINQSMEVYRKLQEFIEKPSNIKNWNKIYQYKKWKIEFKNVDFAYNKSKKIFKNLNLEFLAWKKNALVGHSGWWKSTIVKLILRLYDYQKGEILVDNQDLKKLKVESFYKYIWYLPQEPWIFDGTIRENLEYAFDYTPPLTPPLIGEGDWKTLPPEKGELEGGQEKQIWQALEKAQIADMIRNLEKWLDTEVGEKWVKLSWWEKQRLAIARIFLKNPKIIILDEPTSALDSISENKITKALDELMKWKTSIVIAHRLQTVMHSDKIIVLENGKIEEEWTHKELMKKSKVYKTLVDLQNGKIIE